MSKSVLYYSDPTWGNHPAIFQCAGFTAEKYPYWDAATKGLNFDAMLAHIKQAPDKSVYLLHPIAHNPTGVDPTTDQWKQIMEVCKGAWEEGDWCPFVRGMGRWRGVPL